MWQGGKVANLFLKQALPLAKWQTGKVAKWQWGFCQRFAKIWQSGNATILAYADLCKELYIFISRSKI